LRVGLDGRCVNETTDDIRFELKPRREAQGCESVLVWGGADGAPMIKYNGEGLVWHGLGLWGRNLPPFASSSSSSMTPGRAGTGILIERPSSSPLQAGKIWFGSLLVEHCDTAVATSSSSSGAADEVGFGYFWPQNCDVAVHLNHATSMEFSFEYVHAVNCGTVFKVTSGGRIFTQSLRVLSDGTTILDLAGGDAASAYYHINGLALDDGVDGTVLLNNDVGASGTHHVRFTNAHLICSDETTPCPPGPSSSSTSLTPDASTNCHAVTATIDRTDAGSTGQTMLELVGCRGLSALNGNVTIKGASSGKKSYLIVRESEIAEAGFLIHTTNSSNYIYNGIENWTYGCGVVRNDSGAG
jgi:hypothetical protein